MGESNSSDSKSVSKPPAFRIYNSLHKEKEIFKPKEEGKVGMYVCGVTTYDFSHIGHARAYIAFDLLFRYLKYLGCEVVYVRNFTDIDDKIINKANEQGEDPFILSSRFCDEFLHDMDELQCLRPTHQPRVTNPLHIKNVKEMIEQIISNGYAYINGDVFFSVKNFPHYWRLQPAPKVEDNRERNIDERKRNQADFVLWKEAKPGEPYWDSPWGPGRPGWHIECSAMSKHYLTHSFDIHGGGMDLIFPHHQNELAQNCASCPESDVTYWLHNGMINKDEQKMSKSLKNSIPIRQVTRDYHPLALRLLLLRVHYRSAVNYTTRQMDIESESLLHMYQTLKDAEDALRDQEAALKDFQEKETSGKNSSIDPDIKECIQKLLNEFDTKMSDDLQAPAILNYIFKEALKSMYKSLETLKKKMQKPKKLLVVWSLYKLQKEVSGILDVLGMLPLKGYSEALLELKSKALLRAKLNEEEVVRYIEERKDARRNKEYSRGDEIRKSLAARGIALEDEGMETLWRPCVPVPIQDDDVSVQPRTSTGEKPHTVS